MVNTNDTPAGCKQNRAMNYYAGKITRTHAAKMLLEEKPMPFGEVVAVSGWTPKVTCLVLTRLMHRGDVIPVNKDGKRHYALAFWKPKKQ